MALTLADLNDLQAGYRDPIVAGEMPYAVARQLGLKNHTAYLSLKSLRHILDDHADIDLFTLLHLPFAIQRSMLIQDRQRPNVIMMAYQDPESYRRYTGSLKIAAQECEVWVSTFYRAHRRHTKSLLKRGVMLKKHD